MNEILLYGSPRNDIDRLAEELGNALGVAPEARDSSYFGEYYSLEGPEFEARLDQNMDDPEEEEEKDRYQEPDHKDMTLMFEVMITKGDPEKIKRSINGVPGMTFLKNC
ncbi:hypothetical protein [Frankia sp. Cppng1_Ct_nod]|uniref:hypothetical protein n=1 Tax=Frankia sp. Cppng1_Ct_nod TaxID=2897162 RepID=UPI001041288B|nr:hypothetical protein [Frankia sp. Cppng1_Ct_nod]